MALRMRCLGEKNEHGGGGKVAVAAPRGSAPQRQTPWGDGLNDRNIFS